MESYLIINQYVIIIIIIINILWICQSFDVFLLLNEWKLKWIHIRIFIFCSIYFDHLTKFNCFAVYLFWIFHIFATHLKQIVTLSLNVDSLCSLLCSALLCSALLLCCYIYYIHSLFVRFILKYTRFPILFLSFYHGYMQNININVIL